MAMSYWCSQVVFTPHTPLCRHRSRCLSPPSHTTSSSPTSPPPTPYLHKQSFQKMFILHSCSKKPARSSLDLSLGMILADLMVLFFPTLIGSLNLTTCVTYSMQVNDMNQNSEPWVAMYVSTFEFWAGWKKLHQQSCQLEQLTQKQAVWKVQFVLLNLEAKNKHLVKPQVKKLWL